MSQEQAQPDRTDDYAGLADAFRELAALAEDDPRRQQLRDDLVASCLPLAYNIASRYRGRGHSQEDLRQVAVIGLINAVNRFQPEQGSDFLAFAVPTVMGEVRRYFRDVSWALRVPRRLKELHVRLGSAGAELTQRLNRAPTARELAEHLDVSIDEVYEGLDAASAYQTSSLSEPLGTEDAPPAAVEPGGVDEEFDRVDNRESVRRLLATLPERDRQIVLLRFYGELSQSQIAKEVGLSQMHVSRLLARALNRLREQAEGQR